MKTVAVLLAAGQGKRMKSAKPKVLHEVGGQAMVKQVIKAIKAAGTDHFVLVVGHGAEDVTAALGTDYTYAWQRQQLGTGHAVKQALPYIEENITGVLVACADTPLIRPETIRALMEHFSQTSAACTILTAQAPDPSGYGRIIRGANGKVKSIVEEKDATDQEKLISEVNTGTYLFSHEHLVRAINSLTNQNSQGEYYLTDVISSFVSDGLIVNSLISPTWEETIGVNDRIQLAEAERILRRRKAISLMASGVTILDPQSTYIDTDVTCGADTIIYPGTYIKGQTVIGNNCLIGPDAQITDSQIGNNCEITRSVLNQCTLSADVVVGPFTYLRPGTVLKNHTKAGSFVELKKATVGEGSKVPHLSYIGDALIGSGVNVGCGTITCNYDGFAKHQTIVEDNAFIGSNTNLVAPVTVGSGAIIGAGSTITENVPADALGVERNKQKNLPGAAVKIRNRKGHS